jgi:hypothetical protein
MKNIAILGVVMIVLFLPFLSACQSDTSEARTSIPVKDLQPPTGIEAADDIVSTPGGVALRANVRGSGGGDLWPPIQSANVTLGSGSKTLNINYRDYIDTKAGETRNNIIFISKEGGLLDKKLELYSTDVPEGIGLIDVGGGGRPGILQTVLVIEISPAVVPGQYTFKIGIEVDGKDYGTIPCTINVVK